MLNKNTLGVKKVRGQSVTRYTGKTDKCYVITLRYAFLQGLPYMGIGYSLLYMRILLTLDITIHTILHKRIQYITMKNQR